MEPDKADLNRRFTERGSCVRKRAVDSDGVCRNKCIGKDCEKCHKPLIVAGLSRYNLLRLKGLFVTGRRPFPQIGQRRPRLFGPPDGLGSAKRSVTV
jgi:hypothetical protein